MGSETNKPKQSNLVSKYGWGQPAMAGIKSSAKNSRHLDENQQNLYRAVYNLFEGLEKDLYGRNNDKKSRYIQNYLVERIANITVSKEQLNEITDRLDDITAGQKQAIETIAKEYAEQDLSGKKINQFIDQFIDEFCNKVDKNDKLLDSFTNNIAVGVADRLVENREFTQYKESQTKEIVQTIRGEFQKQSGIKNIADKSSDKVKAVGKIGENVQQQNVLNRLNRILKQNRQLDKQMTQSFSETDSKVNTSIAGINSVDSKMTVMSIITGGLTAKLLKGIYYIIKGIWTVAAFPIKLFNKYLISPIMRMIGKALLVPVMFIKNTVSQIWSGLQNSLVFAFKTFMKSPVAVATMVYYAGYIYGRWLKPFYLEYIKPAFNWLIDNLKPFYTDYIEPVFKWLKTKFINFYDNHLKPIGEILSDAFHGKKKFEDAGKEIFEDHLKPLLIGFLNTKILELDKGILSKFYSYTAAFAGQLGFHEELVKPAEEGKVTLGGLAASLYGMLAASLAIDIITCTASVASAGTGIINTILSLFGPKGRIFGGLMAGVTGAVSAYFAHEGGKKLLQDLGCSETESTGVMAPAAATAGGGITGIINKATSDASKATAAADAATKAVKASAEAELATLRAAEENIKANAPSATQPHGNRNVKAWKAEQGRFQTKLNTNHNQQQKVEKALEDQLEKILKENNPSKLAKFLEQHPGILKYSKWGGRALQVLAWKDTVMQGVDAYDKFKKGDIARGSVSAGYTGVLAGEVVLGSALGTAAASTAAGAASAAGAGALGAGAAGLAASVLVPAAVMAAVGYEAACLYEKTNELIDAREEAEKEAIGFQETVDGFSKIVAGVQTGVFDYQKYQQAKKRIDAWQEDIKKLEGHNWWDYSWFGSESETADRAEIEMHKQQIMLELKKAGFDSLENFNKFRAKEQELEKLKEERARREETQRANPDVKIIQDDLNSKHDEILQNMKTILDAVKQNSSNNSQTNIWQNLAPRPNNALFATPWLVPAE